MSILDFIKKPVSRRSMIKGTAATAAVVGVASVLSGCEKDTTDESVRPTYIQDSQGVNMLEAFSEAPLPISSDAQWSAPLGTILLPTHTDQIPCITSGNTPSHMTKATLMSTISHKMIDIVSEVMENNANWVIYTSACSSELYVWVELNMLDYSWKLYATNLNNYDSKKKSLLWSSDSNFDPPSVVCVQNKVFWQVMPSLQGNKTKEPSYCYMWTWGDSDALATVKSNGRFASPIEVSGDYIIMTPRQEVEKGGVFYAISVYPIKDNLQTVYDKLVLPASVAPLFATYINNQFVFSVEATYEERGLLGKMGTYIGNKNDGFYYLNREPYARVTGNGKGIYIIKSRSSYLIFDIVNKTYSTLDAVDRCLDYGEYPATSGESRRFITFTTVKNEETGYPFEVIVRMFDI